MNSILIVIASIFLLSQACLADTYTYDELNRLTRVVYDDGSTSGYAYDAGGNITQHSSSYSLSFVSDGNGTLSGTANQTLSYGGNATAVSPTPASGYHFVNWTGTGGFVTSTDNPLTVTSVKSSMIITANFALPPVDGLCGGSSGGLFETAPTLNLCGNGTNPSASGVWNWDCVGLYSGKTVSCSATLGYQLSVASTGPGTVTTNSLTATGVPTDITCAKTTCSAGYSAGSQVNVTATPDSIATLTSLTGDCSSSPCTLIMDAGKSVDATFTLAPKTINITAATEHVSFTDALTAALSGAELHLLDTQLDGVFTLDKTLILKGGWNAQYKGMSGFPTLLNGELKVTAGDSIIETVDVKGKLSIQGGSLRANGVRVR